MTLAEARDELAHRWNAPTLMRAAAAEYMHIRDWLPPMTRPVQDLLDAMTGRTNDGERRTA
jgi:hypothetical protein